MAQDVRTLLGAWRPRAVVFDCDGLLMDSEPCWTIAETELFARYGLSFGSAHKAQLIGKAPAAVAATIAAIVGEPAAATQIEAELMPRVAEVIAEHATALPGARELVTRIAATLPVAVASNAPRALLDAALARGGFAELLPVRFAADEVERPKPDPELYLAACGALGVTPAEALAFEDSITGLRSARAAGLRVVGVPTLVDEALPADLVVSSLLDPGLRDWVAGWDTALGDTRR